MIALQPFLYERPLHVAGSGVAAVLPDGALYAHTRRGFADLRIVDAAGNQVPWRLAPQPGAVREQRLRVLDSGRRGALAVARVRTPAPVDRVTLDVPDGRFVGVASAYGSTDGATWTRVATSQIYSLHGAVDARSTTVLLPPNDFRYLELRATHVSRIDGVLVTAGAHTPLRRIPAHVRLGRTIVVDLGHANTPVDELRISSSTPRYKRAVQVVARNGIAGGELVRLGASATTTIPLAARTRYLRVTIANGDDPPLRNLRITAWARPRLLLVEGGHPRPLTAYYGAALAPPLYDFARLPVPQPLVRGTLGAEQPNPEFRRVDTRSVFARHRSLVTTALALAAALLVAAGALAVRRA
ncbi:MAG TPA: hypothetical protein VGK79_16170 [Gaiellaceae bacterium]